jgi:hypothetical protein
VSRRESRGKRRPDYPGYSKEASVDLRAFYHKIRTIEATIPGVDAVVVSLETPDGGRAGSMAEVARGVAAKLVAQGKARLANDDEADTFKAAAVEALSVAMQASTKGAVQLNVMPQADLDLLREALQKK